VTAINARDADDKDLEATFREAQERFVYAADTTLQGIYFKLRLLAQVENLAGHLDESCNLLWPRIILTILRDLNRRVLNGGARAAHVRALIELRPRSQCRGFFFAASAT
jgi:hypothetical protein